MKTIKFYFGMSMLGLLGFIVYSCQTSSPGDAVKAAMVKEIVKEQAESIIEEKDVPAVVVDEFLKSKPDSIERQWLVYKESEAEDRTIIPDVYIVAYRDNDKDYRNTYSKEGKIMGINHVIEVSVCPQPTLDFLSKDEYKDWDVTGDVYETLNTTSNEPTGYIVTVKKGEQKEKLFFDLDGNILKIQTITK